MQDVWKMHQGDLKVFTWRPQGIATTIHDGINEQRSRVVAIPCGHHALFLTSWGLLNRPGGEEGGLEEATLSQMLKQLLRDGICWVKASWSLANRALVAVPLQICGGTPATPVAGQRNRSRLRVSI